MMLHVVCVAVGDAVMGSCPTDYQPIRRNIKAAVSPVRAARLTQSQEKPGFSLTPFHILVPDFSAAAVRV